MGAHLKALYTGLYQQTNEQGVKRMNQRMARPSPTPPEETLTQKLATDEIRLNSRVHAVTAGREEREEGRGGEERAEETRRIGGVGEKEERGKSVIQER